MVFISYLVKGLIIGLMAGIPAGPLGSIVLQRLLNRGSFYGLLSGLGAVAADLIFCAAAIYGLTFVEGYLADHSMFFRIAGGIVIIIVGAKIFISKYKAIDKASCKKGLLNAFISIFLLAFTNPAFILYYASLIMHFDISGLRLYGVISFAFFTGVFTGELFWWLLMTFSVRVILRKFKLQDFSRVNRAIGVFIIILGLAVIIRPV